MVTFMPSYYYKKLRELREQNDLTQSEIAQILQTRQEQYSKYELGRREIPVHHLITLARFYRVSVDYILGLEKKIKPGKPIRRISNSRSIFKACRYPYIIKSLLVYRHIKIAYIFFKFHFIWKAHGLFALRAPCAFRL